MPVGICSAAISRLVACAVMGTGVQVLGAALREGRGSIGVVHLALHGAAAGPVCAWHHELLAVAEPGMPALCALRMPASGLDPTFVTIFLLGQPVWCTVPILPLNVMAAEATCWQPMGG